MTAVSYPTTILFCSLSRLKVKNTLGFWVLPCVAQISPVTHTHTGHFTTQSLLVLAETDPNLPSVCITLLSLSLSLSLTSRTVLREGWGWRGPSAPPAGQNPEEEMMTASLLPLKKKTRIIYLSKYIKYRALQQCHWAQLSVKHIQ